MEEHANGHFWLHLLSAVNAETSESSLNPVQLQVQAVILFQIFSFSPVQVCFS